MATEEEIEVACRAFHPTETKGHGIKVLGWDDYHEGVRKKCREYMRDALEAAEKLHPREPMLSELTIAELQHRIGELEGVLHFKVCGDPRKRVGVATE